MDNIRPSGGAAKIWGKPKEILDRMIEDLGMYAGQVRYIPSRGYICLKAVCGLWYCMMLAEIEVGLMRT